jgi:hypothetical protein
MTITDEGKQLRSEIAKLRPDKRRRYSAALRARILDWVGRAAASGMLESECSKAIGVKVWRFVMWRRFDERARKAGRASLALVPIEAPPLSTTSEVSLVTPSGYRLEGLALDQVVALLRELA